MSCAQVAALIKAYLVRFGLAPVFSKTEVAHWFLPRTDVIVSYVVEDKATGKITDFLSFYSLPSTIIGNPTYKTLRYTHHHRSASYLLASSSCLSCLQRRVLVLQRGRQDSAQEPHAGAYTLRACVLCGLCVCVVSCANALCVFCHRTRSSWPARWATTSTTAWT